MPIGRRKNKTHQSILTMTEGDLAPQRNARHICNPVFTSTSKFIISVIPIWSYNDITKFAFSFYCFWTEHRSAAFKIFHVPKTVQLIFVLCSKCDYTILPRGP